MTQEEIDAIPAALTFPAVAIDGQPVLNNLGNPVTEFTLREPTGAELKLFGQQNAADAENFAIAQVAGLPLASVERLGARVLIQAATYLQSFMQRAQPKAPS